MFTWNQLRTNLIVFHDDFNTIVIKSSRLFSSSKIFVDDLDLLLLSVPCHDHWIITIMTTTSKSPLEGSYSDRMYTLHESIPVGIYIHSLALILTNVYVYVYCPHNNDKKYT